MLGSEALVVRRMPVLRRHYQFKTSGKFVDKRDDLFSIRHFQPATGDEIILYVDDNECAHSLLVVLVSQFIAEVAQPCAYTYFIDVGKLKALVFGRQPRKLSRRPPGNFINRWKVCRNLSVLHNGVQKLFTIKSFN